MNILIVEDNELKFKRILATIESCGSHTVTRTKNLKTTLANIRFGGFELMFLDMAFEVLSNQSQSATLHALAGLQVLQYLNRSSSRIPVVVVTQHSSFHQPGTPAIPDIKSLDLRLCEAFPTIYRGMVFMAEDNNWQAEISAHLR